MKTELGRGVFVKTSIFRKKMIHALSSANSCNTQTQHWRLIFQLKLKYSIVTVQRLELRIHNWYLRLKMIIQCSNSRLLKESKYSWSTSTKWAAGLLIWKYQAQTSIAACCRCPARQGGVTELSMARGVWTHCLELYARHMIALNCDCVISVYPCLAFGRHSL
jgi:hypothetical protein